jgi:ornithine cyclodeaminase/alanine dehydrogenase-like protein (mu-crystallin family)
VARVAFRFLNRAEVQSLLPSTATLLEIIERGLLAHGAGEVVLPPKSHIRLDDRFNGHFNVLPGFVAPAGAAGVKVVGDYVDNYRVGLPSEVAMLTLYDPATGVPRCLMDATVLTWLRTGAVTGIGAKYLARPNSSVVAHLGARGTALGNLTALAALFPLREVRITSKRPESRQRLAAEVRLTLGIEARPVDSTEEALRGADIVVEATRLERPQVLVREPWLEPGALLVTYGWVMAIDPELPFRANKLVVDDWAQCQHGGQLHPLIARGALRREHVHAEIGEIVHGTHMGRADPGERIIFWHRGFAISDIVLGAWIHAQAEAKGVGTMLTLWDGPDE